MYQGDASELVHLQTRILQDLPRALRVPLSDQESRRLARPLTENADAYRAYLQGRYEWSQRSEAALKRGIERFRHAVAIDPHFAAAYSGLADSYSVLGYLSYLSPAETFPEARRHATKALELDASLAEAHASLGFVKLYFEWDWPGAEAAFQRAIALDPNHAASHQWYSIYLLTAGRPARGIAGDSARAAARSTFAVGQHRPRVSLLLHRTVRRGGEAIEARAGDESEFSAGASLARPDLPGARQVRRGTRRISPGRGRASAIGPFRLRHGDSSPALPVGRRRLSRRSPSWNSCRPAGL